MQKLRMMIMSAYLEGVTIEYANNRLMAWSNTRSVISHKQIEAGNTTATQIQAAYDPLNEKTDEFEMCVISFILGILTIAGIDDMPSFVRSKVANQNEEIQTTLSLSSHFDDEFIVKRICNILGCPEEAENVLKRKDSEEAVLTDFTNDAAEEAIVSETNSIQE